MWLTGRLRPDFKTIAEFRRDNSEGIGNVSLIFPLGFRAFLILTVLPIPL